MVIDDEFTLPIPPEIVEFEIAELLLLLPKNFPNTCLNIFVNLVKLFPRKIHIIIKFVIIIKILNHCYVSLKYIKRDDYILNYKKNNNNNNKSMD